MTTHYSAFTVILDRDIRDDDAESLLIALGQLRGVTEVIPVEHVGAEQIAYVKARNDLRKKVLAALESILFDR
jgi:uncharacterized membrane protein